MSDIDVKEYRKRVAKARRKGRKPRRWLIFSLIGGLFHLIAAIRMPWMAFNMVFLMITALKVAIIMDIGETQYNRRLALYDPNDVVSQIGVVVMRPDRLTIKLRDAIWPILHK